MEAIARNQCTKQAWIYGPTHLVSGLVTGDKKILSLFAFARDEIYFKAGKGFLLCVCSILCWQHDPDG